jgi:hypothetical protein
LGWLYHVARSKHYPIPLSVPVDEIEAVSVNWGRLGVGLITSDDPVYGLIAFGAFRPRFERVLRALQQLDVTVVRPDGETGPF